MLGLQVLTAAFGYGLVEYLRVITLLLLSTIVPLAPNTPLAAKFDLENTPSSLNQILVVHFQLKRSLNLHDCSESTIVVLEEETPIKGVPSYEHV